MSPTLRRERLEAPPLDSPKGKAVRIQTFKKMVSKGPGLWRVWAEPSLTSSRVNVQSRRYQYLN